MIHDVEIVYQESRRDGWKWGWFSRYAMPRLRTFSPSVDPFRLPVRVAPKRGTGKAVAVYGAVRQDDGHVSIRCTDGSPIRIGHAPFCCGCCATRTVVENDGFWWFGSPEGTARSGSTWHRSLVNWVKEYNRDAARRGVIRLMIVFLPIGSP
ncbi:MAG: hypothetical protein O3A46_09250 [Candidatus Poribacteria bacterium]|nr:hypothetical protein [Candidatus Poribacteria bacterium]